MIVGYERPLRSSSCARRATRARRATGPRREHRGFACAPRCTTTPTRRAARPAPRCVMHTGIGRSAPERRARASTGTSPRTLTYVATDPEQAEDPLGAVQAARTASSSPGSTPPAASRRRRSTSSRSGAWTASTATTRRATRSRTRPASVDEAIRDGTHQPRAAEREGARGGGHRKGVRQLTGTEKERAAKLDKLIATAAKHGKPDADKAEKAFDEEMKRILLLTSFSREGPDLEDLPEQRRPQRLPRLLPLPRRQAPRRQGRGDPAAMHALPRAAAGGARGRRPQRRLHREPGPHAPAEPRRAQLHARAPRPRSTTPARCATARSSGAPKAAASAPTRRATGASGRR